MTALEVYFTKTKSGMLNEILALDYSVAVDIYTHRLYLCEWSFHSAYDHIPFTDSSVYFFNSEFLDPSS
ncbi:hypothetical protein LA52FAK_40580 [Desulforhopalus sp. 52FAK]